MPGGGTPDEHRYDVALFEDKLAKPVSSLASGSEQGAGDFPLKC